MAALLVAILERRALLDMDGWKAVDCWVMIAPMVMIAAYDFIVVVVISVKNDAVIVRSDDDDVVSVM